MKFSQRQRSRRFRKIKRKGINKLSNSSPFQLSTNSMDDKEKLQEKKEIEDLEVSQVEVCNVCGNKGFSNALIYCSMCSHTAGHQYCLGILPGSIDDTFDWICEYCSPPVEFENLNSSRATSLCTEGSFEELAVNLEHESVHYENEIMDVEELEPLCTLPPLLPHGCSEPKETSNQCLFHELTSTTAPKIMTHLSNYREESESSISSFMELPKEIMSGLLLLASPSGEIFIYGGMNLSPVLENSTVNMTGSCNEMSSDKLGQHVASNLDKAVIKSGEVADEVVKEKLELGDTSIGTGKEIDAEHWNEDVSFCSHTVDACAENTSDDADVREACVMGLSAVGKGSVHHLKRKSIETSAMCDFIPPIGPQCKRTRSKRCKIRKEVDACKLTVTDVPAIGKERSNQPVNGPEVVMPGKMLYGTSQSGTLNTNLMSEGLQVEAISQECGLLNNMGGCGTNVKGRASQVDDRINDQEMTQIDTSYLALDSRRLPLSDVGVVTCNQHCKKDFSSSCQGVRTREALSSATLSASPVYLQSPSYVNHIQQGETCMSIHPSCREFERRALQKITDVEEVLNDNVSPLMEVSYSRDLGLFFSKSTLQRQQLLHTRDTTLMSDSRARVHSLCEKLEESNALRPPNELEEVGDKVKILKDNITYPDAWKEYDFELKKLQTNLEGEKKKLEEVVKRNRLRMWRVVYELETTKKELSRTMAELSKKTSEVEMAKDLMLNEYQNLTQTKEALKIWLGGYSTAERVINQLHPELDWDNIKAVGNLMLLRHC